MSLAHVDTGLCGYDVLPWLSMVEGVQLDRTISLGFCWFLGMSSDQCHPPPHHTVVSVHRSSGSCLEPPTSLVGPIVSVK